MNKKCILTWFAKMSTQFPYTNVGGGGIYWGLGGLDPTEDVCAPGFDIEARRSCTFDWSNPNDRNNLYLAKLQYNQ